MRMAKSPNTATAHQIRPNSLVPGTTEFDAAGPTPHVRSRRGSEIAWSGSWGGLELFDSALFTLFASGRVPRFHCGPEAILGESIFNASRHLSVTWYW